MSLADCLISFSFMLIQLKLFLYQGCKFKNNKYFCSPDFILI
jgi:hypothetical protein